MRISLLFELLLVVVLLVFSVEGHSQDSATKQPLTTKEQTQQEIDSIKFIGLVSNLELGKAKLERLAKSELAQQDPVVMAKIRGWQGELAYQSIAVDRDAALGNNEFVKAYELSRQMIAARSRFAAREHLRAYLDQAELAEAAERAELWQEAATHRDINVRIAESIAPRDRDLATDAKLDQDLTRQLSIMTAVQRATFWEAKQLGRYRFREREGETTVERLQRAAELWKSCLGEESREYGLAMLKSGDAYSEAGSAGLARDAYTTAHSVLAKCLGEMHRDTLAARKKLDR